MHAIELLNSRWFIDPRSAENYYPLLLNLLENPSPFITGKRADDIVVPNGANSNVYRISEFGEASSPESAPNNAIAIMGIKNVITKYDTNCGPAGMLTKNNILERAINNPKIKSIVLDIDSGGGEASAVELISRTIANSPKPIVAYVHGMAASAAYWIASHCDAIVMDGVKSEVGSIGVYITFADFAKHYEQRGIKIHRVYSTLSTEKNKMFEDALKGDYKLLTADLDSWAGYFIDTVKSQRSVKDDSVFKGAMYETDKAIELGLADFLGDFNFALSLSEEMATGGYQRKKRTPTSSYTNLVHNTMFEKFKALSALRGKKATEITADDLTAVNAELTAQGVEGSFLTQDAVNAAIADATTPIVNQLNSAKADRAKLVKLFKADATDAEVDAFDLAGAITTLQSNPAADATQINDGGKGANIVDKKEEALNVWDLDHNKAALENI